MTTINDFQAKHSGQMLARDLRERCRVTPQDLASLFERARYYDVCQDTLPELQELRATQAALVQELGAQHAELTARIAALPASHWQERPELEAQHRPLDQRLTHERQVLEELDQAISDLSNVQPVECPEWMYEFLNREDLPPNPEVF